MNGETGTRPGVCRSIRCRALVVAVLAGVLGVSIWAMRDTADTPVLQVAERGSELLPGMARRVEPTAGLDPLSGAAAPALPGLDVMATKLAARLEREPGDAEGWALLARTYLELGEFARAETAQARAESLRPDDAALKADYRAALDALHAPVR